MRAEWRGENPFRAHDKAIAVGTSAYTRTARAAMAWRPAAAAQALSRGEVATASELETALTGDPRYAIEPLPLPKARDGWVVGLAVKRQANDLAQALQAALNGLAGSGRAL